MEDDLRLIELNQEFDKAMEEGDSQLNESLYMGLEIAGVKITMGSGMTIKKMEELMSFYTIKEDYLKCAYLRDCIKEAKNL